MIPVNARSLRETVDSLPSEQALAVLDMLHRMDERNIARVSAIHPPFYAFKAYRRWYSLLARLYNQKQSVEQLAGFYQDGLLQSLCLPADIRPPLEHGAPAEGASQLNDLLTSIDTQLRRARKFLRAAA